MGSVVGEKITRLVEYATNPFGPLILVCASGGARMQEGSDFGMLGDIIIAEPNAYIAFAGKRVIEQTLNKTVPEGSQAAESLFHKGLFDSIVPPGVLSELFQLHAFFFPR
ncbi:unnamed protein product [Coffea canephora]|uniref:DH200=94 genomic scaffold, scaffold_159 n=1 Tax=Coffea canephora TaxID=49390 RepID=A0A068URY7_COFCA|nr:unnamed protein product [Coffea canephora]CDP17411.1 unnamed protein product [Coffea canephora]